jgi:hypothetical protein
MRAFLQDERALHKAAVAGPIAAVSRRMRSTVQPGRWLTPPCMAMPRGDTGILRNELYVGRLVWDRMRFIKGPTSGKRISRMNPPEQWVTEEEPHLRFVNQELCNRVQSS